MTGFLCGVLVGIVLATYVCLMAYGMVERDRNPYKWICDAEGCDFKIESNSIEVTDTFITGHKEAFHRE